jgi:hypothetical protein
MNCVISKSTSTVIEPSSGFITFILGQLNVARLEALCVANEIATTATALSGGLISAEAAILHLDQLGLYGMSQEYEKHFSELVERFVRERQPTLRREAALTRQVAETTFQAVAYVMRQHGMQRLNDAWLTVRLAEFSDAQIVELIVALRRMQPRYPAITNQIISKISKLRGQA